jgi:phospholipid-binding lipoprotein MlaA
MTPEFSFAQDAAINDTGFEGNGASDFKLDDEWDIENEPVLVNDPFVKYNRFMFRTNDKIYRYILTPLSKGYDFLVPKKVQGSINNFFHLSSTPKRLVNNFFQGKFKSSFVEMGRLLINVTVGVGGLFDPADRVFHLKQQSEDFGQTLGHYGMGNGPYVILPVLGPSTFRDILGRNVDYFLDPFYWLSQYDVEPEDTFKAISYVKRANKLNRSARDNYNRVVESAIDPYIAVQNAFIQNQNQQILE